MDIVLGNYKGLKANIPYIAYTEEDVNSQIATLRSWLISSPNTSFGQEILSESRKQAR